MPVPRRSCTQHPTRFSHCVISPRGYPPYCRLNTLAARVGGDPCEFPTDRKFWPIYSHIFRRVGFCLRLLALSTWFMESLSPGLNPQNYVPYPDFALDCPKFDTEGDSYYNSLWAFFERRFSQGVCVLVKYT